jgi:Ca2+-binding EF-hand superfamily protein
MIKEKGRCKQKAAVRQRTQIKTLWKPNIHTKNIIFLEQDLKENQQKKICKMPTSPTSPTHITFQQLNKQGNLSVLTLPSGKSMFFINSSTSKPTTINDKEELQRKLTVQKQRRLENDVVKVMMELLRISYTTDWKKIHKLLSQHNLKKLTKTDTIVKTFFENQTKLCDKIRERYVRRHRQDGQLSKDDSPEIIKESKYIQRKECVRYIASFFLTTMISDLNVSNILVTVTELFLEFIKKQTFIQSFLVFRHPMRKEIDIKNLLQLNKSNIASNLSEILTQESIQKLLQLSCHPQSWKKTVPQDFEYLKEAIGFYRDSVKKQQEVQHTKKKTKLYHPPSSY